ncbi:MAG: hypothetical protein HQL58_06520 [Magnetococcales bacterium]|nr:hypothetical protein [Magnetococcales bacterium]
MYKFIFITLILLPSVIHADALNRPRDIDAGSAAKVSRAMAETYRTQDGNAMSKKNLTDGAKCGVDVGNVTVGAGGGTPQSVTTVVTGSVINVCK